MGQSLKQRSITEFAAMAPEDTHALVAAASELRGATQSAMARRVLRGKNLAVLTSGEPADAAATIFQRAAVELGAQVAQVRSSLSEVSPPDQVQHTARVLGRLYDGIECIGMSADLVARIGSAAGVPVFEAISSKSHPICGLASQLLDGHGTDEDRRCAVLQAVLIAAMA